MSRRSRGTVRILSIDGGGIRGLIPAIVLRRLDVLLSERADIRGQPRKPLSGYFDLIAGASTGAVLAVGLAGTNEKGLPLADPDQLIQFYSEDGPRVFAMSRRGVRGGLIGSKYIQERLAETYAAICGSARLSNCITNLLVPAYDLEQPGVYFFRGGADMALADHDDFHLSDVLLAATAAPYLFPPARIAPVARAELRTFVDGGVFATNPALDAYLEARQLFGTQLEFLILSLGTAPEVRPVSFHTARHWGLFGWLNPSDGAPLIHLFMHGQADNAHNNLRRLLPDTKQYFRLDHAPEAPLPALDDTSPEAVRTITAFADAQIAREEQTLQLIADRLVQER